MNCCFVASEDKYIFIIKRLVQIVLFPLLLLSGSLVNAHQVRDNWCWCLTDNGGKRLAARYRIRGIPGEIAYPFRFLEVSRCNSAKSTNYLDIDYRSSSGMPEKPVQIAYAAPGCRVVYIYFEYMLPSFFQTLTADRKALLLKDNPYLKYSDDLFDETIREMWQRMLSLWGQPEKRQTLLEEAFSTPFGIADYILGFSPPPSVYQFYREYKTSPDRCLSEEGFVLGKPVDGVALDSQLQRLQAGQVWFLEESVKPGAVANNYYLCVIYMGGGLFLLLVDHGRQYFLNADDFFRLIGSTLRFDKRFRWKAAMVRTSNGAMLFSLKMQKTYPVSVTDFLYKEVEL